MRLHRFFIEERIGDKKEITLIDDNLLHQWRTVFRMKPGDLLILLDNTGFEFLSRITNMTRKDVTLFVEEKTENKTRPKREVFLFQSLIKKNNFEWLLEKATEIGVSHIRPVIGDRSEKKGINFATNFDREKNRAKKIITEACEQSGRGKLPALYEPMDLEEAICCYSFPIIAFHPLGRPFDAAEFEKEKTIGVLIGPEGGWSVRECEFFNEKKVRIISLGSATLRSETAALAASSLLLL